MSRNTICGTGSKSPAGLPLYWMDIAKYNEEYVFITYDDAYRGDAPHPQHYIIHRYETLDDLIKAEDPFPTEYRPDRVRWKWLDWKPDLLNYLEEA